MLGSRNITVIHVVLDGIVKNFPVGYLIKDEIPVLPSYNFSCLIAKLFYEKFHGDLDTTVTLTRRKFWI